MEDPKEELVSKLEWVYDPAPYVFGKFAPPGFSRLVILIFSLTGYYCKGSKVTLCALIRPVLTGRRPVVHDLVTVEL